MNSPSLILLLEKKKQTNLLFGLEQYYSMPNSGTLTQASTIYIKGNKDITESKGTITICGVLYIWKGQWLTEHFSLVCVMNCM